MSLHVLAQGSLAADPQERASSAGKPFVTCLLRVLVDGEESMLASLIAFDTSAVKALMQLHKGDPVSVAGMGKPTQWTGRDGVEKRGMSVTVQAVLSIYQARKRKREAPEQGELEEPEISAPIVSTRCGADSARRGDEPIEEMANDLPW